MPPILSGKQVHHGVEADEGTGHIFFSITSSPWSKTLISLESGLPLAEPSWQMTYHTGFLHVVIPTQKDPCNLTRFKGSLSEACRLRDADPAYNTHTPEPWRSQEHAVLQSPGSFV